MLRLFVALGAGRGGGGGLAAVVGSRRQPCFPLLVLHLSVVAFLTSGWR